MNFLLIRCGERVAVAQAPDGALMDKVQSAIATDMCGWGWGWEGQPTVAQFISAESFNHAKATGTPAIVLGAEVL